MSDSRTSELVRELTVPRPVSDWVATPDSVAALIAKGVLR